jgi:hypothetical protein
MAAQNSSSFFPFIYFIFLSSLWYPSTYQTTKGAVGRIGKKILRSPNLDDLPVAKYGDTVRDLDGRPPMGNQKGCSALKINKRGTK